MSFWKKTELDISKTFSNVHISRNLFESRHFITQTYFSFAVKNYLLIKIIVVSNLTLTDTGSILAQLGLLLICFSFI